MEIPLSDPKRAVDEKTINAVVETLKSGRYILGNKTKELERVFSGLSDTKFSVSVSSGTSALQTALMSCGIGRGDEVITTAHSFIATANAIVHAGAKPVLVDIDSETMSMDAGKVEERVTDKTRAIMPVHLYGHPADMDPIREIAERHDLFVIEDACQAHGAEYKGRRAGSLGDVGCFSLYPSKVMTVAGDGGMITTNNEDIRDRAVMIRNQGRRPEEKYSHDTIGFNFRMSEMAATIGVEQLKRLEEWIESRRGIAGKYNKLLGEMGGVTTPVEKSWAKPVYYVYTIRVDPSLRGDLSRFLKENGISTGIYYPIPIHKQPAYSDFGFGSYPESERVTGEILSLPMHPYLKDDEIEYIAGRLKEFLGSRGT
jgi:dTDP-4-amino-4,6-dideoxygalactose transaminase